MRYAVASHFDEGAGIARYARGAITITATPGGGLNIEPNLVERAEDAFTFGNRAAASIFAGNLTDLCGALPGCERTWFVVELPEPRK